MPKCQLAEFAPGGGLPRPVWPAAAGTGSSSSCPLRRMSLNNRDEPPFFRNPDCETITPQIPITWRQKVVTGHSVSRRRFLALAGLTGTGLGLAACAPKAAPTAMDMGGTPQGVGADDMDAMHKQGVDTFVANAGQNPDFWGKQLEYK